MQKVEISRFVNVNACSIDAAIPSNSLATQIYYAPHPFRARLQQHDSMGIVPSAGHS